jgi:GMP synthase-like glutamine amidotransferase
MKGKLLVLDNSLDVPAYRPVGHWEALAQEPLLVHRPQDDLELDLAGVTHVFVTGSEASINEESSWIERHALLLRRIVALRIPTLASCFGHQLLARALWGKSFVRRSPTPEFGWVEVGLNARGLHDELFEGCSSSFNCLLRSLRRDSPATPGFRLPCLLRPLPTRRCQGC